MELIPLLDDHEDKEEGDVPVAGMGPESSLQIHDNSGQNAISLPSV